MLKFVPLVFIIFAFSCVINESNPGEILATNTVISPPLEGDFVNDATFEIDPSKENTLETSNGSYFTIPSNSLVDANGNLVKDKVTITFNQYHSIPDILTSGIPMDYDSIGTSFSLESAGMFTLEGKSKDNPIYLKEGTAIEMNLASDYGSESPYNFYELDENTGDWTFEHSSSPLQVKGNPKYDPFSIPQKPEPVAEDAFIIDVNLDISDYEELTAFTGVVWEYTGIEDSLDPRKNKWINRVKWNSFDLNPTNELPYEYFMTMNGNSRSFTTRVKAALNGTDLDIAMAEFEQKKIETAKKMESLPKPYIRSVNIDGFGTYNYDYIHRIDEPAQVIADFDFDQHNSMKGEAIVAVVYEDDNFIVNYPKSQWSLFGIDTQAEAKIIAILPGNQLAIYKGDVSDCYDKQEHTFKMEVVPNKIETKGDLIDILASI